MADTRELLLDAAEHGMRRRGYHAVSFRDLAAELESRLQQIAGKEAA